MTQIKAPFYGVRSTKIYCRSGCASRQPKPENVVLFDSGEEAEAEGFRPCKRCRPDLPSYAPAVELAERARAAIDRNLGDREALRAALNSLGVTRRHLTEVFEKQWDLTPEEYAAQVRLRRAKELLDGGSRITDAALAVGMESPASFAAFFRKREGITPSEYAARRAEEHPSCLWETPLGPVRIEADSKGITLLKFADCLSQEPRPERKGPYLEDAGRQLQAYFAGERQTFDVPLSLHGSEFQERVWRALRAIPYGETRSYQQIAQSLGDTNAARAVGMANNRNPVLILVPCHRVVGKNGKLVGYAAGISRKEYLLHLEAAQAVPAVFPAMDVQYD